MASGDSPALRQGSGQKDINLDDYLEELRIANASPASGIDGAQRDLSGLGIGVDAGLNSGSPYGEHRRLTSPSIILHL